MTVELRINNREFTLSFDEFQRLLYSVPNYEELLEILETNKVVSS